MEIFLISCIRFPLSRYIKFLQIVFLWKTKGMPYLHHSIYTDSIQTKNSRNIEKKLNKKMKRSSYRSYWLTPSPELLLPPPISRFDFLLVKSTMLRFMLFLFISTLIKMSIYLNLTYDFSIKYVTWCQI